MVNRLPPKRGGSPPFCRHDSLMPGLSRDHYTSPSPRLSPHRQWGVTSENSVFLMSSPQEMGCVHHSGDCEVYMADKHHQHTVKMFHWFYLQIHLHRFLTKNMQLWFDFSWASGATTRFWMAADVEMNHKSQQNHVKISDVFLTFG